MQILVEIVAVARVLGLVCLVGWLFYRSKTPGKTKV
jgi:hypothetical protein